jgi:hypothetical protein
MRRCQDFSQQGGMAAERTRQAASRHTGGGGQRARRGVTPRLPPGQNVPHPCGCAPRAHPGCRECPARGTAVTPGGRRRDSAGRCARPRGGGRGRDRGCRGRRRARRQGPRIDVFPGMQSVAERARAARQRADRRLRTRSMSLYRIRKKNGPHTESAESTEFSRAARRALDCIRGGIRPSRASTVSARCSGRERSGLPERPRERQTEGGTAGWHENFLGRGCGSRAGLHGARQQDVRTT